MFKLRNLISLAFIVIFGILVYNRFLGTEEEQEQAKTTFQTIGNAVKDVGNAVGGLLKSEKEKFDEGKYGDALDKIGDLFQKLGDKAKQMGDKKDEYMETLQALEEQKKALEDKVNDMNSRRMTDAESTAANEELKADLSDLYRKLQNVTEEASRSGQ